MADLVEIRAEPQGSAYSVRPRRTVLWLQVVTLLWMLVECGVALYSASAAHSPAIFAFGSDSLIELASASVVLLQFVPAIHISDRTAGRTAAVLLYLLSGVVTGISVAFLARSRRPETSVSGIAITIAALIVMPILASLKRREARRTGNVALAADAIQSATCAYLALTALAGVSTNALWHISWVDPAAALVAVPFLLREGRSAWRGHSCGCCG